MGMKLSYKQVCALPGVDKAAVPFEQPHKVKRHKYGAHATTVDGVRFASKKEAKRYGELHLLVQAGKIQDLELHPAYELHTNGVRVGKYTADFRYFDLENLCLVVEDVKSRATKTTAYRLRKRMVEAEYGIKVMEV